MALTGCQQLNDGVNTVNGAISSSLSSVGKALGGTPPLKALARYRLYLALVLSAKTMKKTQWQQKKMDWQKDLYHQCHCSGSYEGQKCQRYDDGNAQISP
jgi:hypothetical protein